MLLKDLLTYLLTRAYCYALRRQSRDAGVMVVVSYCSTSQTRVECLVCGSASPSWHSSSSSSSSSI